MIILHGTWIPDGTEKFLQAGSFYLWAEVVENQGRKAKSSLHPFALDGKELSLFLEEQLKLNNLSQEAPVFFLLPSTEKEPLASPEMALWKGEQENGGFD